MEDPGTHRLGARAGDSNPIVNYIEDAEREGDTELVEYFKEVQEHDAKRGQETSRLSAALRPGQAQ